MNVFAQKQMAGNMILLRRRAEMKGFLVVIILLSTIAVGALILGGFDWKFFIGYVYGLIGGYMLRILDKDLNKKYNK